MEPKQFSRTALSVAVHRAAHQTLENGAIFRDPFARTVLGPDPDAIIAERSTPNSRPLRLFVAVRARFAEDSLAAAIVRDVRQAVVLGAGLDTLALRNPYPGLAIYEVDHPATQDFKRERLKQMNVAVPDCLRFAPVDFEHESFLERLRNTGFEEDRPAFFIWLGVVPYLTREAISATLDDIASLAGSEVVFDYTEPLENYAPEARERTEQMARWAATAGEPWLSFFDPSEIAAILAARGLIDVDDLGPADFAVRYLGQAEQAKRAGPHIVRARKPR
jgi:methyltransferase (TIGR00027 family)